jgi:sugar phosphate isomerase/epimerase
MLALAAAATITPWRAWADESGFKMNFILASALYGTMDLDVILPEAHRTGAEHIDIWCLKHGNQREQIETIGHDAFSALLQKHNVKLGALTRYPLGPFGLRDELKVLKKFGGRMIVTGSGGPKGLSGAVLKTEMKNFIEKMKAEAAIAEELGVTIAIENHSASLLSSPDSLRYFAEYNSSKHLGIAFAPHHLHEVAGQMPKLIEDLGSNLAFVYAQEHGRGFTEKLPKEQELQQLPGFGGGLDYRPVLSSLKKIKFTGWIEIFMHPTPRGVPILPSAAEITSAINKSREHLEKCLRETP